ncbi:hypothetical protein ES703_53152 [subsurface metagenome]
MRRILLLTALVLLTWQTPAQDIVIDYLEGYLEIRTETGWREGAIGDRVTRIDVVRIDSATIAELRFRGDRLILSEEGMYAIRDLISASEEIQDWGLRSALSVRLHNLFEGVPEAESASMGVRAGKVEDEGGFDWVDEEEEAREQGEKLLEEKKFTEAIEIFKEALFLSDDESEQLYLFYIGYAHAMKGDKSQALKYLNRSNPAATTTFYPDYILLRGELLIESHAYRTALDLFGDYLQQGPRQDVLQSIYLFSAFCSKGLGDRQGTVRFLNQAYRQDPDSEIGRVARSILDTL